MNPFANIRMLNNGNAETRKVFKPSRHLETGRDGQEMKPEVIVRSRDLTVRRPGGVSA